MLRSIAHLVSPTTLHFAPMHPCTNPCTTPTYNHLCIPHLCTQMSVIAKHELRLYDWVELSQFIMQQCESRDATQREVCVGAVNKDTGAVNRDIVAL